MEVQTKELNQNLLSEVNLLEEDISDGEEGLVRLRNTLSEVDLKMVEAQGLATRITEEMDSYEALIEDLKRDGYTERTTSSAEGRDTVPGSRRSKSCAQATGRQRHQRPHFYRRRQSPVPDRTQPGRAQHRHPAGYLLQHAGGQAGQDHPPAQYGANIQRKADKWTRTLNTVDWLTAQLPVAASTRSSPSIPRPGRRCRAQTANGWMWRTRRSWKSVDELRKITPSGGTSLENAFVALQDLSPPPDNIFLITDGLPTQGASPPRGQQGQRPGAPEAVPRGHQAVATQRTGQHHSGPMEGDPMAASELWQLAQVSRGSFLSPSRDWP